MERFSVESTGTVDHVVVAASGEADLAAADLLGDELDRQIRPGRTVVVDCSGMTFIDSTGLRTLIAALRKSESAGARFLLAAVPDSVARVLDLAGVTGIFVIQDDPAGAVTD
jgi:anti-anti-sigma factor